MGVSPADVGCGAQAVDAGRGVQAVDAGSRRVGAVNAGRAVDDYGLLDEELR